MSDDVSPTATIARHSIHAMLVPFPVVCFVGAFATDLAYWGTTNIIWETFSVWLIAAGLVIAGFAVIAGLIDFLFSRRIRAMRSSWPHVFASVIVLVLSLINVFVHSRDGYTAVVPTGLILSALVVVIMFVTDWFGREIVYRQNIEAIR